MICEQCGFTNAPDARFCILCGGALVPPEASALQDPDPKLCPGCGTPNEGLARFCSRCGASMEGAPRRSEAPEAAAPLPHDPEEVPPAPLTETPSVSSLPEDPSPQEVSSPEGAPAPEPEEPSDQEEDAPSLPEEEPDLPSSPEDEPLADDLPEPSSGPEGETALLPPEAAPPEPTGPEPEAPAREDEASLLDEALFPREEPQVPESPEEGPREEAPERRDDPAPEPEATPEAAASPSPEEEIGMGRRLPRLSLPRLSAGKILHALARFLVLALLLAVGLGIGVLWSFFQGG